MVVMRLRCDGPACRLRAGDCGLGAADGEATACLRRCDVPVAASDGGAGADHRRTRAGRALPGARRCRRSRACRCCCATRGFADQPTLAAARRRGAYLALAKIDAGAGGRAGGARRRPAASTATARSPRASSASAIRTWCSRGSPSSPAAVARPCACRRRSPTPPAAAREFVGDFEMGERRRRRARRPRRARRRARRRAAACPRHATRSLRRLGRRPTPWPLRAPRRRHHRRRPRRGRRHRRPRARRRARRRLSISPRPRRPRSSSVTPAALERIS